MKGTAWRVYLGIGALATGAYYRLPYDPAGAVLNVVVGDSAVAAQCLFVAGDALFSFNDLMLGIEPFPSLADGIHLAAYVLLGAAGLHPSMAGLSEPSRRRQARLGRGRAPSDGDGLRPGGLDFGRSCLSRARLLAMGAAALVAPALLVLQRLRGGDIEVMAVAGAWAALFVLVMGRMAGLVRAIERAESERRRVLDRTVQAAEQERMHVASELHDGPIQRLAVLSFDLERAKQRMLGNPAAVARVEHAQAALSAEVNGLRELMASLRPPTLDEVGLEAALRDHVGAFARRSGVDCSVRVHLDGRLDGELETVIYRVAQEALLFQVNTRPGAGVTLRAMFRVSRAA
jgi:signal transduction histidine kinase